MKKAISFFLILSILLGISTSLAATKVSGSNLSSVGGTIDDFKYEIEKNNIKLTKYIGTSAIVIVEEKYELDGKKYNTDLTDCKITNRSVRAVYFSEGIKEINDSIFNGSDVMKIYLPKSMNVISTRFLGYLHADNGDKVEVYYPGKQAEFEKKLTNESGNQSKNKAAQKGADWANKLNNMLGIGYDPDDFDFIFEATKEDFLSAIE